MVFPANKGHSITINVPFPTPSSDSVAFIAGYDASATPVARFYGSPNTPFNVFVASTVVTILYTPVFTMKRTSVSGFTVTANAYGFSPTTPMHCNGVNTYVNLTDPMYPNSAILSEPLNMVPVYLPMLPGHTCSWIVDAGPGRLVRLSDYNLNYNVVPEMFDGSDTTAPRIYYLRDNTHNTPQAFSSGRYAFVRITTPSGVPDYSAGRAGVIANAEYVGQQCAGTQVIDGVASPTGTIMNPLHGNVGAVLYSAIAIYRPNTVCTWRITAPPGGVVLVRALAMTLADGDSVLVRDGDTSGPILLDFTSPYLPLNGSTTNASAAAVSSGALLTVQFVSLATSPGALGFQLSYTVFPSAQCSPAATSIVNVTNAITSPITFSVPVAYQPGALPYTGGQTCNTILQVPTGLLQVMVVVTDYDLAPGDSLVVQDMVTGANNTILTISGGPATGQDRRAFSSQGRLKLIFTSVVPQSNHYGVRLTYNRYDTTPGVQSCNGSRLLAPAYTSFINVPLNYDRIRPYTVPGGLCNWTIVSASDQDIVRTYVSLDVTPNVHFVLVYDGNSTRSVLLANLTGQLDAVYLASTGQYMLLIFDSRKPVNTYRPGMTAQYISTSGPYGGTQFCDGVAQPNPKFISQLYGIASHQPYDSFTRSPPYRNCSWLFSFTSPGVAITLSGGTFGPFSSLMAYDGDSANDTLIMSCDGTVCTPLVVAVAFSGSMFVTYQTRGSGLGGNFDAGIFNSQLTNTLNCAASVAAGSTIGFAPDGSYVPAGYNCSTIVFGTPGTQLQLQAAFGSVYGGTTRVFDGTNATAPLLYTVPRNPTVLPLVFSSTNQVLVVWEAGFDALRLPMPMFYTNSFMAPYYCQPYQSAPVYAEFASSTYLPYVPGDSLASSYGPNLHCVYFFEAPAGYVIFFSITDQSNPGTIITYYDGKDTSSPAIINTDEFGSQAGFLTTGRWLTVDFDSGPVRSSQTGNVKVTNQALLPPAPCSGVQQIVLTYDEQIVLSLPILPTVGVGPSLAHGYVYPPNLNCTWEITSPLGTYLHVIDSFTNLGTGDVLSFDENGFVLDTFSGRQQGTYNSDDIHSQCNTLRVTFTSDSVAGYWEQGFWALIVPSLHTTSFPAACRVPGLDHVCTGMNAYSPADLTPYQACQISFGSNAVIANGNNMTLPNMRVSAGYLTAGGGTFGNTGELHMPQLEIMQSLVIGSTFSTHFKKLEVPFREAGYVELLVAVDTDDTDFSLEELEVVGTLHLENMVEYETFSFPSLRRADWIYLLTQTTLEAMFLPVGAKVAKLTVMDAPFVTSIGLESIDGASLQELSLQCSAIRTVDIPGFAWANALNLLNNAALTSVNLPRLKGIYSLTVTGNAFLTDWQLPSLAYWGTGTFAGTSVVNLALPSLYSVGAIKLCNNVVLSSLQAPLLTSATKFQLQQLALTAVELPSLRFVSSTLSFTSLSRLTEVHTCQLRYVNTGTLTSCPAVSCADLQLVVGRVTANYDASSSLACDRIGAGVFGCALNSTNVVNTTRCGFTVACIQATIDASYDEQSIKVYIPPGTYTGCNGGPLTLRGKMITVYGAGAGSTVIDCQGAGRALVADSDECLASEVSSMTFRNGTAAVGGLISVSNASPTLRNLVLESSLAVVSGGAIDVTGGAPVMQHLNISGCQASIGGAISLTASTATIMDVTISACSASDRGGGIAVTQSTTTTVSSSSVSSSVYNVTTAPLISDSMITDCTAPRGGGLFTDGPLRIRGVLLGGNTASQFGGGAALVPNAPLGVWVHLLNVSVIANTAPSGGGIYTFSANVNLTQGVINGNSASRGNGAGLFATCSENYRFLNDVTRPCDLTVVISASSFLCNIAAGNGGNAALLFVSVIASDSSFAGGRASLGGGVYASTVYFTARRIELSSNAADRFGGGLYCEPLTGSCDMRDSSVIGNYVPALAGAGVYLCVASCVNSSTTGDYIYYGLTDLRTVNTFSGNRFEQRPGGYGVDLATDPYALVYVVPPPMNAISGRTMINSKPGITLEVRDGFGNVVTVSENVLTISLFTRLMDGTSATDWAAVAGSQTIVVASGRAEFDGVAIVASHVQYVGIDYQLVATLSPNSAVTVGATVTLMPCAPGQGRASVTDPIVCNDCSAGEAGSGTGDLLCLTCQAGTFAATAVSGVCASCPENTYAPLTGATSCLACPAGYSAPVGSIECSAPGSIVDTGVNLGTALGASFGVLLVLGAIVILYLWRLARKRTMKSYYLDADSTIRTGSLETPLQRAVKKMVVASSTTRIGGGVYADIYKAKYETQWVALKVLKGEMVGSATAMREFQRETIAMIRLNEREHPGIVKLLFFLQKRPMCIGMEFCPNGTLKNALGGKLLLHDKLRMLAEAASGMTVLHSLNIAHLDLKTDNLLLDEENHIKILDFGISRTLDGDETSIQAEFDGMSINNGNSHRGASESNASAYAMNPVFGGTPAGSRNGSFSSNAPLPQPQQPPPELSTVIMPDLSSAGSSGTRHNSAAVPMDGDNDIAFTPQYVDPARVINDRSTDMDFLRQADVYSFAMIIFAVMGQQEPYATMDPRELIEQLKTNPLMRPFEASPLGPLARTAWEASCPAYMDQLMQNCWSADRGSRPSFKSVFETLSASLKEHFDYALERGYAEPNATPRARRGASVSASSSVM